MNDAVKWGVLDLKRIRTIFVTEILVVIVVGIITGYAGVKSGIQGKWLDSVGLWSRSAIQTIERMYADDLAEKKMEEVNKTNVKNINSNVNVNINTNTTINNTDSTNREKDLPTNKPVGQKTVTAKTCYRYTVVHLDNSTSNLCYNLSDYNNLVSLGGKLSTAKSFYEFDMESAAKYQGEYDRTKSSIYLDAKASSEADAAREKEKIGSTTLQMQEIEKRGF